MDSIFPEFSQNGYHVKLATSPAEIIKAKTLRYQVFYDELGGIPSDIEDRLKQETDQYDKIARHLIVIDEHSPDRPVVGTYRLIDSRAVGHYSEFYSAGEFDLSYLNSNYQKMLELGRSCIHKDHRNSKVFNCLWMGIAAYMICNDIEVAFGCVSFLGASADQHKLALNYLDQHHTNALGVRPVPSRNLDVTSLINEEDDISKGA
ncbi:MAG: GNAT family N-acetyltransferase, partial [Alphaproteobacteria bacterium]|nr:GNAT family N-acetyltransferase [Alphaproteobacteria bacterium]